MMGVNKERNRLLKSAEALQQVSALGRVVNAYLGKHAIFEDIDPAVARVERDGSARPQQNARNCRPHTAKLWVHVHGHK